MPQLEYVIKGFNAGLHTHLIALVCLSLQIFIFTNGYFLTRDRFVRAVRSALNMIGVDSSHYVGHSFRIGAASYHGIPKSHGNAYK